MIGMHNRGVSWLAQVIGIETEPTKLGIGVQGIVHDRGCTTRRQLAHYREDAGERRFLDSAPISCAEHSHAQV